jgi:2-dehydropantoate 2-reductase
VKTYVVGAGAIGTYLGGLLRATGAEVGYAPRRLEDVEKVSPDLALVAVKAYDTPGAVATLRRALADAPETTILTVQNGLGNEELLAGAFGADRIASGALTVPVERGPDGSARAAQPGGLGLAPVGRSPHNWLVAAFERAGLPVVVCDDYRALKWSKLALNIVANASCAILDMMPAELVRDPALFGLELEAVRETHAVMEALSLRAVDLPRYPVRAFMSAVALPGPLARGILAGRFAKSRGTKPPSLLIDLRAGRRTEIAALNGAVAAAGAQRSVATPVNAAYSRVLEEICADPALWESYRRQPQRLIAAVRSGSATAR